MAPVSPDGLHWWKANGSGPSLVCFPPAGGNATSFVPWLRALPEHVNLAAVNPPGRFPRASLEPWQTVDECTREISAAFHDEPLDHLVVVGASLGGLLAFETARVLTVMNRPPTLLCVIAAYPPCFYGTPSGVRSRKDVLEIALLTRAVPVALTRHPDFDRLILGPLAADMQMTDEYVARSQDTVGIPLLAVAGDADDVAPGTVVTEWANVAAGEFSFHVLAGDHSVHKSQAPAIIDLITRHASVVQGAR